ncbi:MAG: YlxR family protein [Lachnospiraceae bacterium]|nr:YlxR family protein [Lachnospiraceae bacterium]
MAGVKKQPQRACIGCGQMREKRELIRVLRTPEGEFTLDRTGRKNGRGAYLCRNPECLEKAMKNHSLERSFKKEIPPEVYSALREELLQT